MTSLKEKRDARRAVSYPRRGPSAWRVFVRWLAHREIEAERVRVADALRSKGYGDIARLVHMDELDLIQLSPGVVGPWPRAKRGLKW